jgi:hypothetical protein
MNTKKLLLATVASFAVMFALGGLWHMMLMENWYNAHVGAIDNPALIKRDPPMLEYIALGCLVLAFLMSYMYGNYTTNDSKIMKGLRFGMVMGLIAFLPFETILYGATMLFSRSALLVDTIWNMVNGGIGGIVIAMVYGGAKSA